MTAGIIYREPKLGGSGRPPIAPNHYGGGDSGGRGDNVPDDRERLKRYRLGLALGLVAITMLFVGAATTFIFRHHFGKWSIEAGTYVRDWQPIPLPMALLWANTLLLLASSVTAELGRRESIRQTILEPVLAIPGIAKEHARTRWTVLTAVFGSLFLLGQTRAWSEVVAQGFRMSSGPSSSFFYLLTGAHAFHLVFGVLALVYAAAPSMFHRDAGRQRIVVDVASWYWHVMGALWVGIFALLVFVR